MVHLCGTNYFDKVGMVGKMGVERDGTGVEGIVDVFELFEAEKVEQKSWGLYAAVVDRLGVVAEMEQHIVVGF